MGIRQTTGVELRSKAKGVVMPARNSESQAAMASNQPGRHAEGQASQGEGQGAQGRHQVGSGEAKQITEDGAG